ncbi:MAG TPA: membrane dipeptidase [Gemmatimonadetes bacterium]|nr:membrane dipeptidase [Gemmatimonadota bacterium]
MTRLLFVAVLLASATTPVLAQDAHLERVRRILAEVPLVDGHNDLPGAVREASTSGSGAAVAGYDLRSTTTGDTDLHRLRQGMVGAQFWSVHVNVDATNPAREQLEQIDIAHRIIERYPDHLELATSASEIMQAFGRGKIASLLGIEGGHVIENSLGALRAYYLLGVRYMTLAHFTNTDWADSATDEPVNDGLSTFGEDVVREMNRLGMLVDISHVSPATMNDVLDVAEAPVIFSHSGARAVTDHVRNVPDGVLARLPENGGLVMQVFYPPYVSEEYRLYDERSQQAVQVDIQRRFGNDAARIEQELERWRQANPAPVATISDVADHIEHIRDVAGIDHVGLGSDFDGIPTYVDGLDDVSTFPALLVELSRRGWSDEDLRKVAGENLLRVMREAEAVASRLQRAER